MKYYLVTDSLQLREAFVPVMQLNQTHACLLRDEPIEQHSASFPYLFTVEKDSEVQRLTIINVWGNAWVLIVHSIASINDLYKHFRRFLMVQDEEGKRMYFKFYDPQVLRIFLPTCNNKQIIEFFGPVESFIVEGESKEEAIRFWQENGILKQEILPIEQVFGNLPAPSTDSRQSVYTD